MFEPSSLSRLEVFLFHEALNHFDKTADIRRSFQFYHGTCPWEVFDRMLSELSEIVDVDDFSVGDDISDKFNVLVLCKTEVFVLCEVFHHYEQFVSFESLLNIGFEYPVVFENIIDDLNHAKRHFEPSSS